SVCFFFQAEDGIRDRNVTGVQTCALPILSIGIVVGVPIGAVVVYALDAVMLLILVGALTSAAVVLTLTRKPMPVFRGTSGAIFRSEERRVGKECRSPRGPARKKKA